VSWPYPFCFFIFVASRLVGGLLFCFLLEFFEGCYFFVQPAYDFSLTGAKCKGLFEQKNGFSVTFLTVIAAAAIG
jgi:hypothetical protein